MRLQVNYKYILKQMDIMKMKQIIEPLVTQKNYESFIDLVFDDILKNVDYVLLDKNTYKNMKSCINKVNDLSFELKQLKDKQLEIITEIKRDNSSSKVV